LSLGSFVFLIFAKLFNRNVGMFFKEGQFQALGLIKDNSNYQEVLGGWFIPIMIFAIVTLYFMITLLLKLKKSINKK
jgi:phosphotransferase system  glucose/maltose/N-acetylglucosamine-specific IIC component